MPRGPKTSGHRLCLLKWTRWDWARFLLNFCLFVVIISMIFTTFKFWFIPKANEYPGVGDGPFPSAGFRDFTENSTVFWENYYPAVLLHISVLTINEVLSWVLQLFAFSLIFMLFLKIYDILETDIVALGSRSYVELAMGSLLVGIILMSSGVRGLLVMDRIYNTIAMAIISFVLLMLERLRKSIETK